MKLNTIEKVNELIEQLQKVKESESEDKIGMFKEIVDEMFNTEKEKREQEERKKAMEEEKKAADVTDSNWSKEEIALLTKAIIKFPPGTKQRWYTITDYIGRKSQKEVIKKAQELKNKRENELSAKAAEEENRSQ